MTYALKTAANEELVELFAKIALKQYDAIEGGDNVRFRTLFKQIDDVSNELRSRDGDQRRMLMALYVHDNSQVRLKAAVHTLAVAPVEARAELESIARLKWEYQAGDAGMTLCLLDNGTFKPS